MNPEAAVDIFPNPDALARAMAQRFVARAAEAIAAHGCFSVALAGGTTPQAAYRLLAGDEFSRRVDWARVEVLWGDERCVPPDDPRSNYRMAREAFLDRVPILPANIHRITGEDEPREVAAAYERMLRALLGPDRHLDLVLLGMGEDGHTASLFPGHSTVRETVRWVVADYAEALAMWRITLTPVVINAAHEVSFLVQGRAKAERLREVLKGPFRPEALPAQIIRPVSGRLTWFVDKEAASQLG